MSATHSNIPKYYSTTLENNLTVVAVPTNNGTNVVSCDVFYKVGSGNEVMGKSGIAHMLEHLNFKSTKNLQAGEFDKIVKQFGGVNNASTSFDQTHYYIRTSKENVAKALDLYADIMQNLQLKDEEFQPERDVVAEERRWRTDNNPIGYLYFRLFNTAYTYHPYHWTPIGFMNDIQTWSIDDIKAFHAMYYQPQNAVVVVSGDISKEEVFDIAKKKFGHIKNSQNVYDNIIDVNTKLTQPHFVEPTQDGARRAIIEKTSEVQMLALAYKIPNFEHEDQYTLSIISELLSAGKTARLYKSLVDEKRLVNQVYAYNLETKDPGLFIFLAVCNPGIKATQVEQAIHEHIDELKNSLVPKAELDKVKLNTQSDFVFGFESASTISSFIGEYFTKNRPDLIDKVESSMQKVTAKDIKRVANTYFVPSGSTTLILKSPKEHK